MRKIPALPSRRPIRSNMKTGIRTTIVPSVAALLATLYVGVGTSVGQQPQQSVVQQATFTRPAADIGTQKVSFARQAAHVGDEVEQNIGLDLRMTMTMRQGNELTGKNQTTLNTSQRRILTTTEVGDGRTVALRVQYPVATK